MNFYKIVFSFGSHRFSVLQTIYLTALNVEGATELATMLFQEMSLDYCIHSVSFDHTKTI